MGTIPETNILIRCLCSIREHGAEYNFLAIVKVAHVVKIRPQVAGREIDRVRLLDLTCPVTRLIGT